VSTRRMIGLNVFDAAIERMVELYESGARVVVSMSGGKDSTCGLEVSVIAAQMTGRLPVEAVTRDEEIMFPGTYEYLDRVKQRDDVDLHHLVAGQPIINAFNRESPYWWVFDDRLDPEQWVRQPPPYAEYIDDINIEAMTTKARFPVAEGQTLASVIGLRVQESRGRLYGLHSSGGYMTKPHPRTGVRLARPIYDWTDGDVWKAIHSQGWDYNVAYDAMHRLGVPRTRLRIGPPSMSAAGANQLRMAATAWPNWWDRVVDRLPGMQTAAQYGIKVLSPIRKHGESWEECFRRTCILEAPAWISARAARAAERILSTHKHHSTSPLPESDPCYVCGGSMGSWKQLASMLYNGDPFAMRATILPYVEPEFFRPGAGRWNGSPTHS
jgi:predicted phosphoadenosine phosphosulfate sulfurtransferase